MFPAWWIPSSLAGEWCSQMKIFTGLVPLDLSKVMDSLLHGTSISHYKHILNDNHWVPTQSCFLGWYFMDNSCQHQVQRGFSKRMDWKVRSQNVRSHFQGLHHVDPPHWLGPCRLPMLPSGTSVIIYRHGVSTAAAAGKQDSDQNALRVCL